MYKTDMITLRHVAGVTYVEDRWSEDKVSPPLDTEQNVFIDTTKTNHLAQTTTGLRDATGEWSEVIFKRKGKTTDANGQDVELKTDTPYNLALILQCYILIILVLKFKSNILANDDNKNGVNA